MQRIIMLLAAVILSCSTGLAQGPPPARVVVAEVSQREVAENQAVIGFLYYDRVSHVSTEVPGLVETVAVRAGDRVRRGEALVTLNTELLDRDIALTRVRISRIGLRIEQADKNLHRFERLYAEQGVSEKEYEDALYASRDLQKEKGAAGETLEKLLIKKRRSVIRAPFDGVVLEKNVDSGDWVQQGRQLVRLGSTADLFVKAPVAEALLRFAAIGKEVPLKITALGRELSGKIDSIGPSADAATKNVFLKIRIPPQRQVAENMSVTAYVPAGPARMLRIIPRDALVRFKGKDFVYTVKEGKAVILPVHIVAYLGDAVAVDDSGIRPGMPVVVEGNERLRPGQPVSMAGGN